MLTQTEIGLGIARLQDSRTLKPADIEGLSGIFASTFAGLDLSAYDWVTDLTALDDYGNTKKLAAQIAACIIKLEDLGFTGGTLQGGRSGLSYSQAAEYQRIVIFAFSKLYTVPVEFSTFDLRRANFARIGRRVSTSAQNVRVEPCTMDIGSERELRSRTRRRY